MIFWRRVCHCYCAFWRCHAASRLPDRFSWHSLSYCAVFRVFSRVVLGLGMLAAQIRVDAGGVRVLRLVFILEIFVWGEIGKVWLRGQDLGFSVPQRRLCLLAGPC